MNLIEQLGGYLAAKRYAESRSGADNTSIYDSLQGALLEYRRQHNIFEVGDKVVYTDDFMPDGIYMVSRVDDRVWLNNDNAVCIEEMVQHATNEEIEAGHRL